MTEKITKVTYTHAQHCETFVHEGKDYSGSIQRKEEFIFEGKPTCPRFLILFA